MMSFLKKGGILKKNPKGPDKISWSIPNLVKGTVKDLISLNVKEMKNEIKDQMNTVNDNKDIYQKLDIF